MKDQNIEDELASIRNLMERSSKFISLSGLSGVMAGVYALIGSVLAYRMVYSNYGFFGYRDIVITDVDSHRTTMLHLVLLALSVLIAAMGTGILLSYRKAKKRSESLWTPTTRSLLISSAIPLVTGGIFMLILITRGYYGVVAPASLIFYGLAVISGSHYTFTDVKYLGILEIVLGLISALYPGYGLIFWALGFGVLHIIYGSLMYFKYDR
jgi:uncharacterized membrane protein YidH (DUF202 family)